MKKTHDDPGVGAGAAGRRDRGLLEREKFGISESSCNLCSRYLDTSLFLPCRKSSPNEILEQKPSPCPSLPQPPKKGKRKRQVQVLERDPLLMGESCLKLRRGDNLLDLMSRQKAAVRRLRS